MTDQGRFASTKQIAEKLGIHEESVRRLIREGKLPAFKLGRQWFVDADFVVQFASSYDPKSGRLRRLL